MVETKKRGGVVVGPPHSEGGVPYVLNDAETHIEEEGLEVNIPVELTNSAQIYEFTGTNAEILNKILALGGLSLSDKVTTVKSGDIVICIKSAWDNEVRNFKGTLTQILSAINTSRGCKLIDPGAKVEVIGNGNGVEKNAEGGIIEKENTGWIEINYTDPEGIDWAKDRLTEDKIEQVLKKAGINCEKGGCHTGSGFTIKTGERDIVFNVPADQKDKAVKAIKNELDRLHIKRKDMNIKSGMDIGGPIAGKKILPFHERMKLLQEHPEEFMQVSLGNGGDVSPIVPETKSILNQEMDLAYTREDKHKGLDNISDIDNNSVFESMKEFFAGLTQQDGGSGSSKYYGSGKILNGQEPKIRVSDHTGNYESTGQYTISIIVDDDLGYTKSDLSHLIVELGNNYTEIRIPNDKRYVYDYIEELLEHIENIPKYILELAEKEITPAEPKPSDIRKESGGAIAGKKILPFHERMKLLSEQSTLADGGISDNRDSSEKSSNFTNNITKDEIQSVISGTRKVINGTIIQAIASYLRRSTGTSPVAENSQLYKKQETEELKTYITKNNLWFSENDLSSYLTEGAEQKIYLIDAKTIIKINDSIFYNSWKDYLHSLLLHNYFFSTTAYELIGFMEKDDILFAVVKQPFVKATEKTNLEFVKNFMAENGFVNTKNNDYYNQELGIILEDLHDENVLTKDGILYFVDTVFYLSNPDIKKESGGAIAGKKILPFHERMKLLQEHPEEFMQVSLEKGGDVSKFPLAPNGKPSNLTPEQYHLVRTPQFKNWFGDWENKPETASKVVDENGEPMIVYHGTNAKKDFFIFDEKHSGSVHATEIGNLGFYFTDDFEVAENFTRVKFHDPESKQKKYARIISCFLNLRNPHQLTIYQFIQLSAGAKAQDIINYRNELKHKNIDSVIIDKAVEDWEKKLKEFDGEQYVAFEPDQIKLADGTNTTFAPDNPDIRYEKGGKLNKLIEDAKRYNDAIDEDIIQEKMNLYPKKYKGHILDNIPENQSIIMVDSSLFEKEKYAYSPTSEGTIAYHPRPSDIYWDEKISQGERPPVLVGLHENQLRVRDGNHRLNTYLNKNFKEIPVILTTDAKKYLSNPDIRFDEGGTAKKENGQKQSKAADQQIINPNSPRWQKKKDSITELSNNIHRLRSKISRDLSGEDEKELLTALIIAVMDKTGERVGNDDSARNGHYGISGLRKKHISVIGDKVHLSYTGKSGVQHEKSFSDKRIAKALKKAIKNSPNRFVFSTADGFIIKADKVNRYLQDFNITAKDIRGYNANKWIVEKLQASDIPKEEKERKRKFIEAAKKAARRIGHGVATLKKHYMVPELPQEYIMNGKIIDLKELGYYKEGGEL